VTRRRGARAPGQVVLETDSSTFVSFLGRSSSRAEDPPDAGLRGGARRAAESDQARDVVGGGAYGGAPRARLQFSRRLAQCVSPPSHPEAGPSLGPGPPCLRARPCARQTCPVSTGGGTRLVQLVRGEGRDLSG
jgi:hypothetical protein